MDRCDVDVRKNSKTRKRASSSPDVLGKDRQKELRKLKEKARCEIASSSRYKSSRGHHRNYEDDRRRQRRYDWQQRYEEIRKSRSRSQDNRREPYHRKDSNDYHKRNRNPSPYSRKSDDNNNNNNKKNDPPEIKPNFELTGALARDTNTFNGIVVKYNQPPEAKKPRKHWRLYPFKGEQALDYITIHNQSAYLLGRERKVADIPIDHPSCSKQHAVIQFRSVPFERADGTSGKITKPYIIDLDSANGTYLNSKLIKPRCYVELFERDVLRFGYSSRDYVLLHEHSNSNQQETMDEDNAIDEGIGGDVQPIKN